VARNPEMLINETKDKEQLLEVWGDIVVDQRRSSQLDEVEGGKEGRREGWRKRRSDEGDLSMLGRKGRKGRSDKRRFIDAGPEMMKRGRKKKFFRICSALPSFRVQTCLLSDMPSFNA